MRAVAGLWNYWAIIVLMMTGLYVMIARENLVKKIMGLNLFQVSVILFYVSIARVEGGTAPILSPDFDVYSNPLPHVLMLTAIVVGVSVTAVGLALVVRIREAYGTAEDDELRRLDEAEAEAAEARGR